MPAELTPNARKFLEQTTMKSVLGIPDEALDTVMAVAFQLYEAGRYVEVEILCRGLVAADQKYWWSYSLLAATLRRLGRLREALNALEQGLTYEPADPKLLLMHRELGEAIACEPSAILTAAAVTSTGAPASADPTPPSMIAA